MRGGHERKWQWAARSGRSCQDCVRSRVLALPSSKYQHRILAAPRTRRGASHDCVASTPQPGNEERGDGGTKRGTRMDVPECQCHATYPSISRRAAKAIYNPQGLARLELPTTTGLTVHEHCHAREVAVPDSYCRRARSISNTSPSLGTSLAAVACSLLIRQAQGT